MINYKPITDHPYCFKKPNIYIVIHLFTPDNLNLPTTLKTFALIERLLLIFKIKVVQK